MASKISNSSWFLGNFLRILQNVMHPPCFSFRTSSFQSSHKAWCHLITWSHVTGYLLHLHFGADKQQPKNSVYVYICDCKVPARDKNTCATREQTFPCCFLYIFTTKPLENLNTTTTKRRFSFSCSMALWKFCAMFMQELVENVFSPFGVTVYSTSGLNLKLDRTVIWAVDEREARRDGGKSSCPKRSCSFSAEWKRSRYSTTK